MEGTIENEHAAAVLAFLGGKPKGADKAPIPSGGQVIRVIASADRFVIRTSAGEADVPSRVKRAGVLFVPPGEFAAAIADVHTKHYMEIDASPKRVMVNGAVLLIQASDFALFPDVASAPETWRPERPKR